MLVKGVLRAIVPWQQARPFFVGRLRRRLTEEALVNHIAGERWKAGRQWQAGTQAGPRACTPASASWWQE
jgi:hypothetical protein